MLLGLRVDGLEVNGPVQVPNSLCEELLGNDFIGQQNERGRPISRGQGIFLAQLKAHYSSLALNEESTEEEKIIKTRNYIMMLFGCLLFPESTGNSVNMMYLPLLRDFNQTREYSWGSAVLAYLYSSLCKNAKKDTCTFNGCALLLQVWGWWRMDSLSPMNNMPFEYPYATK